jgi:hypothetical protein
MGPCCAAHVSSFAYAPLCCRAPLGLPLCVACWASFFCRTCKNTTTSRCLAIQTSSLQHLLFTHHSHTRSPSPSRRRRLLTFSCVLTLAAHPCAPNASWGFSRCQRHPTRRLSGSPQTRAYHTVAVAVRSPSRACSPARPISPTLSRSRSQPHHLFRTSHAVAVAIRSRPLTLSCPPSRAPAFPRPHAHTHNSTSSGLLSPSVFHPCSNVHPRELFPLSSTCTKPSHRCDHILLDSYPLPSTTSRPCLMPSRSMQPLRAPRSAPDTPRRSHRLSAPLRQAPECLCPTDAMQPTLSYSVRRATRTGIPRVV